MLAVLSEAYSVNTSWLRTVHDDLLRIAETDHRFQEYKGAPLADWVLLIQNGPGFFAKAIKASLMNPEMNTVAFWLPAGKKGDDADIASAPKSTFSCVHCAYVANSPQSYSWHLYDKHQVRSEIRKYIHSTICQCCLRYFRTRERIVTHIQASSPKCYDWYRQCGTSVPEKVLETLENEAYELTMALQRQGRRRTFGEFPPERTFGPLTCMACELGVRNDCLLTKPPSGH